MQPLPLCRFGKAARVAQGGRRKGRGSILQKNGRVTGLEEVGVDLRGLVNLHLHLEAVQLLLDLLGKHRG